MLQWVLQRDNARIMDFRAVIRSAPKAEVTGSHAVGRATKPLAKNDYFQLAFSTATLSPARLTRGAMHWCVWFLT